MPDDEKKAPVTVKKITLTLKNSFTVKKNLLLLGGKSFLSFKKTLSCLLTLVKPPKNVQPVAKKQKSSVTVTNNTFRHW